MACLTPLLHTDLLELSPPAWLNSSLCLLGLLLPQLLLYLLSPHLLPLEWLALVMFSHPLILQFFKQRSALAGLDLKCLLL